MPIPIHPGRIILWSALILLQPAMNATSQDKPPAVSVKHEYKKINELNLLGSLTIVHYQLANGLQVAIVRDTTTPVFTYQTWFKTGSADEDPGRQGLAHLFEHMMFRETKNHSMGEFDKFVNENGGRGTNAYTARDQTVYFFSFPEDKFKSVADIEADRMINLVIDSAMFETEKGAVLTEKKRGLSDPTRFLWEKVYDIAYTKHAYKYSGIGEESSIKSFTVKEAKDFYKNFYSPNNALILVVGDVDPDKAMDMVAARYGSYQPSQTKKREVTTESPQQEDRTATVTHPNATQRAMAKVWHIPNMQDPDYPALSMVGRLLTAGKSAILNQRLVDNAKVTSLFADAYMSKDLGTFEFYVQLSEGESYEDIEKIFHDSMTELAGGTISDEQIQIVKNNILKDLYRSVTNPSSLAGLLGDGYIYANDLAFQINVAGQIDKVTRDDIKRVIAKYILNGKSTTVKLEPEKKS
jgi:predicted Zn-dependent peptidase